MARPMSEAMAWRAASGSEDTGGVPSADSLVCMSFLGIDSYQSVAGRARWPSAPAGLAQRFPHRAAAAFLAIALRLRSDSFAARAFPPLDAPSADNACA